MAWQHMATRGVIAFISFFGIGIAFAQPPGSQRPTSRTEFDGDKSGGWLFPVERLNDALPPWVQLGGEYRTRVESNDGIGYTTTNDTFLLSRFRFNVTIQPAKWL